MLLWKLRQSLRLNLSDYLINTKLTDFLTGMSAQHGGTLKSKLEIRLGGFIFSTSARYGDCS